MTMPHLMNCSHSEFGWCLDCVKAMHDEYEATLDDLRGDYLEAMGICWAAHEFAAGRITENELIETTMQGDSDEGSN